MKRGPDLGSDHFPMECSFGPTPMRENRKTRVHWSIRRADWRKWSNILKSESELENEIIGPADIQTANNWFTQRITEAAEASIPKTSGYLGHRTPTPWWDSDCAKVVAKRRNAKHKLWKSPTPQNLIQYKKFEAMAKRKVNLKKKESWELFTSSIDVNTPLGVVWGTVRAINGKKTTRTIPIGNYNTSSTTKAELLLQHFTRLDTITVDDEFTHNVNLEVKNLKHDNDINKNMAIEYHEVKNVVRNINKVTTPGIDDVSYAFIKRLPDCMLYKLWEMFNISYHSGALPIEWKQGTTCPIPKPGKDATLVTSYRPITMLSCIGKLMEKVILKRIDYVLERGDVFSCNQTGFRRGRSTIDALTIMKSVITGAFGSNKFCLVVYLDLEGAFDCVWHGGLVYKLKKLGFDSQLLMWVRDYLNDRTIRVVVGGEYSDSKPLRRGLSQGAALSPTLFNVMLHDMPSHPEE